MNALSHPVGILKNLGLPMTSDAEKRMREACDEPATPGHVIDIGIDGTATAMHNDKIDLSFLGKQEITRATEIKFCEDCQKWGIFLPKKWDESLTKEGEFSVMVDDAARNFDTYEGARKVEVAWLNASRLANVSPSSYTGISILQATRRALGL